MFFNQKWKLFGIIRVNGCFCGVLFFSRQPKNLDDKYLFVQAIPKSIILGANLHPQSYTSLKISTDSYEFCLKNIIFSVPYFLKTYDMCKSGATLFSKGSRSICSNFLSHKRRLFRTLSYILTMGLLCENNPLSVVNYFC